MILPVILKNILKGALGNFNHLGETAIKCVF
jgi:hypothetical protein